MLTCIFAEDHDKLFYKFESVFAELFGHLFTKYLSPSKLGRVDQVHYRDFSHLLKQHSVYATAGDKIFN